MFVINLSRGKWREKSGWKFFSNFFTFYLTIDETSTIFYNVSVSTVKIRMAPKICLNQIKR